MKTNLQTTPAAAMSIALLQASLILSFCAIAASAVAQEAAAPPAKADEATTQPAPTFSVLPGRWVRPDGGYTLTIKSVGADGKLDASYANPSPLPFSKAEASLDGKVVKVLLELTAGGYNGSTFTLTYDPTKDVLKGVYYQAVAKKSYDIYFERAGK